MISDPNAPHSVNHSDDTLPPPVGKPSRFTDVRLWKLGKDSAALINKATVKYRQIIEKGPQNEQKFQADIGKLREQRDKLFAQKQKLEGAYGGLTSEKKAQQLLQITDSLETVEKLCREAEQWQSALPRVAKLNETLTTKTSQLESLEENIALEQSHWEQLANTIKPEQLPESQSLIDMRAKRTELKKEIKETRKELKRILEEPAGRHAVTLAEADGSDSTRGRVASIGQQVLWSRQYDEARLHMSQGVPDQRPTADRAGFYLHERVDKLKELSPSSPHYETMKKELLARSTALMVLNGPQRRMQARLTSLTEEQVAAAPPLTSKEVIVVRGLLAKGLAEIHVRTTFKQSDHRCRELPSQSPA